MRWPGDASDVDDDILEPLLPGSEETLPGFDAAARSPRSTSRRASPTASSELAVVKPRNPKVLRLWLLAAGLGVMSLLQFAAAGYVRGIERDLRDVEAVWRSVLRIDSDRAQADAALIETLRQYGHSPGLEEQRDTLYEATRSRFDKFVAELASLDPRSDTVTKLRDDMLDALAQRRRDFRDERVSTEHEAALREIGARLDRTLDRWRIDERPGDDDVRLTAARELMERLEGMADEPTGLTIGAVAADALLLIDVDDNDVVRQRVSVSSSARLLALGDNLVVVDGGKARAFSSSPLTAQPRWEIAAERAMAAPDAITMWVQVGSELRRIDADGQPVITVPIPEGSRLVAVPTSQRALIVSPADGLLVTTREGQLESGTEYRRMPRTLRIGSNNGAYAAALDDRGRVLVARIEEGRGGWTFSALRADLPRLLDLVVIAGT